MPFLSCPVSGHDYDSDIPDGDEVADLEFWERRTQDEQAVIDRLDDVMGTQPFQVPFVPLVHDVVEEARSGSCVVCRTANATHACCPCGHRALCIDCKGESGVCPVCNQPYDSTIRIYDV